MVRPAETRDVSRIAEILVFGKRAAYRPIFNDDDGSFNGLQVLDIIDEYRGGAGPLDNTLVYDDGIVKGMLKREYDGDAGAAELCELYVDPFFTGMRVGHALMEYFIGEARERGMSRANLWVIKKNAGARRFYESFGFAFTGIERDIEGTSVVEARYVLNLWEEL